MTNHETSSDLVSRLRHGVPLTLVSGVGDVADTDAADATMDEAATTIERLAAALTKISAIRDSIIGFQNVGWSEHIYPLVAALHEGGFDGIGYDEARKNVQATLDARKAMEYRRALAAESLNARQGEALKPFSDFAGSLFMLNWNASDRVLTLDLDGKEHWITAGAFFKARAALPTDKQP